MQYVWKGIDQCLLPNCIVLKGERSIFIGQRMQFHMVMSRADLSLVALLTIHAFPTPTHLFSLHSVQFPKAERRTAPRSAWQSATAGAPSSSTVGIWLCPALAEEMERDFCIADIFMPRKRLSLDRRFWGCLYFLERSTALFLSWFPCF